MRAFPSQRGRDPSPYRHHLPQRLPPQLPPCRACHAAAHAQSKGLRAEVERSPHPEGGEGRRADCHGDSGAGQDRRTEAETDLQGAQGPTTSSGHDDHDDTGRQGDPEAHAGSDTEADAPTIGPVDRAALGQLVSRRDGCTDAGANAACDAGADARPDPSANARPDPGGDAGADSSGDAGTAPAPTQEAAPAPTPTPTPTPTATASPADATPAPTPTPAAQPDPTPTATAAATASATPSPTASATPTPAASPAIAPITPNAALPTWTVTLTGGAAKLSATADGKLTIAGQTRAAATVGRILIVGSALDDTLTIDLQVPLTVAVNFDGGAGTDTLVGPTQNVTWNVTARDAGTVAGMTYARVENVTGSANNRDTFVLAAAGAVSGVLDGGAGGFDTLVVDSQGSPLVATVTGPQSGTIGRGTNVVTYKGLEPVTVSGASTITINAPNAATVVLADSGTTTDKTFSVDFNAGGETHSITAVDTVAGVTLKLGTGTNNVTVNALDPRSSGR